MRKDLGKKTIITPLPVLMIGTYDENGNADVMNAAWGGQCGPNHIALNLSKHKTTENLEIKKEFTVSFATKNTMEISDYFGIVSAKDEDKISKSGVHISKSNYIDAPIVEEYPLTIECKMIDMKKDETTGEHRIVGEVVNLSVDDTILDENGNVDLDKLEPIAFDSSSNTYRVVREVVGNAFKDGMNIK